MDKYKQALLVYYKKARDFLLKKSENSKIKYKNLTVCSIGLLIFILICLMLVPSRHDSNTMMLHPDDISSANEEVSFADNNAVAVTPSVDEETSLQIKKTPAPVPYDSENSQERADNYSDEPSLNNEYAQSNPDEIYKETEQNKTAENQIVTNTNEESFLYCGKYQLQKNASEHKAKLAFSAGLISSVVKKNGNYTLKLGPFKSREAAISTFEKMDKLDLVDECQLEQNKD